MALLLLINTLQPRFLYNSKIHFLSFIFLDLILCFKKWIGNFQSSSTRCNHIMTAQRTRAQYLPISVVNLLLIQLHPFQNMLFPIARQCIENALPASDSPQRLQTCGRLENCRTIRYSDTLTEADPQKPKSQALPVYRFQYPNQIISRLPQI